MTPTMTSSDRFELLRSATDLLSGSGIPNSRWDSELLMKHVLDCKRVDLYTADFPPLDIFQQRSFADLIQRRQRREPLQYLTGTQEFWGQTFKVSSEVLIPRPETEFLIEAVLEQFPDHSPSLTLADIGTGCGCLAITLAGLYPHARVLALDVSGAALGVAKLNAEKHALASRIEFLKGDLFAPLTATGMKGKVDLLISNPPYIPSPEIQHLQAEVRSYEPRLALDGGRDGLDLYRRILSEAGEYLRPAGRLLMEIGVDQQTPISDLARGFGWSVGPTKPDLQMIPRVMTLSLSEHSQSQRPTEFKRCHGSAGASAGGRGACEDPASFHPQRPTDFNG